MGFDNLIQIDGVIVSISQIMDNCGSFMVTLNTSDGIVNIILTGETYVVDNIALMPGMSIAVFYDGNAPVPLMFPPQYPSLVIVVLDENEHVTMGYFDESLTAWDQTLQLNIEPGLTVYTMNGQIYTCSLENRNLLVFYDMTTRSIPPQTSPRRVIVMER